MDELMNITDQSLPLFLERWYGPPTQIAEPLSVVPSFVPAALRRWHQYANSWPDKITHANYAIPLSQLEVRDGKIEFWSENQGCWIWSTLPGEDNPPVFDMEPGVDSAWRETGEDLSTFLLHATVYEALTGAPYSLRAERLLGGQVESVIDYLSPSPFLQWRWPSPEEMLYIGTEVLVAVSPSMVDLSRDAQVSFDILVGSYAPDYLSPIRERVDFAWTAFGETESGASCSAPPPPW
ncbi:hypothetical protein [Nonomuraea turcica]|uniref:hypothetical protein n=1 Tax=Nonomuraea sp. G32 TaxID=3067274 RepID=UPI00273AC14F|nr:hypothetical protein [Nonomuraea sp. G32]MDP4511925.1 hypothetical protein [Nonomuraea sp. G32]